MLLKKWTTAVIAIANSTEKKAINTGAKMVPSPNPEKNVSMQAKKADIDTNTISTLYVYLFANRENKKFCLPPEGVMWSFFSVVTSSNCLSQIHFIDSSE